MPDICERLLAEEPIGMLSGCCDTVRLVNPDGPEAAAHIARLTSAWDFLAANTNCELTHGPVDGDLSECAWQVHRINGGMNDREWTLIGQGETPLDATLEALRPSTEGDR